MFAGGSSIGIGPGNEVSNPSMYSKAMFTGRVDSANFVLCMNVESDESKKTRLLAKA